MHEGHRKRIMERLDGEGGRLQDHELLEILLFGAQPRKNTNPVAHALIDAFGSLSGVFSAPVEQLVTVEGVGVSTARYIRCVGLLFERVKPREEDSQQMPSAYSLHAFVQYLAERYRSLSVEVFELFCTDSRGNVKAVKKFTSYDSGKANVPAEEVSRFLAAHRPDGLVVAHNHPDCTCKPSAQDDKFTVQLQMCCMMNNVCLRDHVITGADGTYSYFLVGRLESIKRDFSMDKIMTGKHIE